MVVDPCTDVQHGCPCPYVGWEGNACVDPLCEDDAGEGALSSLVLDDFFCSFCHFSDLDRRCSSEESSYLRRLDLES